MFLSFVTMGTHLWVHIKQGTRKENIKPLGYVKTHVDMKKCDDSPKILQFVSFIMSKSNL